MCVVDIDTGAAQRLPLSVGPATHYQPLTDQATPSATHFSISPTTNKVRFPAPLEFRFVRGEEFGFLREEFRICRHLVGRLIRQQSVRRKPRGARERGRNQLDSS